MLSRTARIAAFVGLFGSVSESATRTRPGVRVDMHIQWEGLMCMIWTPGLLLWGMSLQCW